MSLEARFEGHGASAEIQADVYYIHFFVLHLPSARELHGKPLGGVRFRRRIRDRPEPRFIRWHYNQCIKARIRGFAFGMEASGLDQAGTY